MVWVRASRRQLSCVITADFRPSPIAVLIGQHSDRQRPKTRLRSARAAGGITHRSNPSRTVGARDALA
eukprot:1280734-Prymnesium_polylepis.1